MYHVNEVIGSLWACVHTSSMTVIPNVCVGNNLPCFTPSSVCVLILACASQLVCCSHCTFATVTSCSCLSCCHCCLCPEDLIDHCLHHWGDSVPPGGIRSLRQHHEGQSHHPPAGGRPPHYTTVGHICHRLLHQLCHHHDPQPYV